MKVPTKRQRRAVDNVISGRFKSIAEAMREAGYAATTAGRPAEKLARSKGVQAYLEQLDHVARKAWNMSVESKVMLTYLDGLSATTLKGRNATVIHPDFAVRKIYADAFSFFFGWFHQGNIPSGGVHQQFNFFDISEPEREAFGKRFKEWLKEYYSGKPRQAET